jgi:hypothetical protein
MRSVILILLADMTAMLTCQYCFAAMAHGRRVITGEWQPEQPYSEWYAEDSAWRR